MDPHELAAIVLTTIQAEDLGVSVTAARTYTPRYDLKDCKTIQIAVVPGAVDSSVADRSSVREDVRIDVGVMKKLTKTDPTEKLAEIDALMALVRRVAAVLRRARVFGEAVWVSSSNAPLYDPDHLEEWRQFTSVINVTLRQATQS